MTDWRNRPPTRAEIDSHKAAHPPGHWSVMGPWRTTRDFRWMYFKGDGTPVFGGAQDNKKCRPCNIEGEPVDWPEVS